MSLYPPVVGQTPVCSLRLIHGPHRTITAAWPHQQYYRYDCAGRTEELPPPVDWEARALTAESLTDPIEHRAEMFEALTIQQGIRIVELETEAIRLTGVIRNAVGWLRQRKLLDGLANWMESEIT